CWQLERRVRHLIAANGISQFGGADRNFPALGGSDNRRPIAHRDAVFRDPPLPHAVIGLAHVIGQGGSGRPSRPYGGMGANFFWHFFIRFRVGYAASIVYVLPACKGFCKSLILLCILFPPFQNLEQAAKLLILLYILAVLFGLCRAGGIVGRTAREKRSGGLSGGRILAGY